MAGSFRHIVEDDGSLVSQERLIGMLDTVGDVYETIEEMYGMIWWLADTLDKTIPSMFGETNSSMIIEQARLMSHEGLEISASSRKEH